MSRGFKYLLLFSASIQKLTHSNFTGISIFFKKYFFSSQNNNLYKKTNSPLEKSTDILKMRYFNEVSANIFKIARISIIIHNCIL